MWLYCPQPIKLAVVNIWYVCYIHVTPTRVWNKILWFQAEHTLDHIWFQADHTLDHIWFQTDHGKIIVWKFVWFVWCHNMVRLWSTWSGNPWVVDINEKQVFFRDQTESIVLRSHESNQNSAKCNKIFHSTYKRICETSRNISKSKKKIFHYSNLMQISIWFK